MRHLEAHTKRIANDLEYVAPEIRAGRMVVLYHKMAWDFAVRALLKAAVPNEAIEDALLRADTQDE